jgi:hypothetical protein
VQYRPLALVQQLGLSSQLLLPPGELLLRPLADTSRLLLGGLDPLLGFFGGPDLQLLGFRDCFRTDFGCLADVGFEP